MPFKFQPQAIPDVVLIEPASFSDHRGFFLEAYKHSAFREHGLAEPFVQLNFSHSVRGAVRGLHYQLDPHAQGKLIWVVAGEIFDAAVDLRRGSVTYGRWISVTLRSDAPQLFYVPPGFAHGFQALSEHVDVIYAVTTEWMPAAERAIRFDDPSLAIPWPLATAAVLTDKDAHAPLLRDAENNYRYQVRP